MGETLQEVSNTMSKVSEVLKQQLILIQNINTHTTSKQSQGLHQHYVQLHENEKNGTLINLLGKLKNEKSVVFVKSPPSCIALCKLLNEHHFTVVGIHRQMKEDDRLQGYKQFKEFETRILVSTDFFDLNMDIASANIIFNYHMPDNPKTYLHRVGGANRFGTKGLAITFVVDENDAAILDEVQKRFEVQITEIPDETDVATYIENR